jgi:hypothetical protein
MFSPAALATDLIFIGIAVALHTIVRLPDALLDMLAANIIQAMFFASTVSVATVSVSQVTGHAARIVVEFEIIVVVEACR